MLAYQQAYRPAYARPMMAQARPVAALPPPPDFLFTGYGGAAGFLETAAVLTFSAAAVWVGVRTGLKRTENAYVRAAGWVGGIGVALMALLYLGGKTGMGQELGIPAVRISPA